MNLHYQFWVDYYDLFEDESVMSMPEGNEKDEKIKKTIQRKNHELVNSKWKLLQEEVPLFGDMQTLAFKVLYPGLLMGLGYEHSTDLVKDAPKIALGMSLDYTTGLPVISGSEAKGMLRSAFIGSKDLIKGYLAEVKEEFSQLTDQEIHALEVDIFGHTHTYDTDFKPSKEAEEGHGKDIFFDAFPIRGDKNGHLIGLENITSHISYDPDLKENPRMYQGLTDPNPITLLKVMPDVVFLFRFKLCDSEITVNNKTVKITAEQKLKLFENIITDFGMGAKTNVGFGLLEKCEIQKSGTEYIAQIVEVKKRQIKVKAEEFSTNPIIKIDEIPPEIREEKTDLTKVGKFTVNAKCRIALKEIAVDENGKEIRVFSFVGMMEGSI